MRAAETHTPQPSHLAQRSRTENLRGYGSPPARGRHQQRFDPKRPALLLLPDLLIPLRERAQPQRVQADEARGVAVVVGDLAFFERDKILVVKRIRALAADHVD